MNRRSAFPPGAPQVEEILRERARALARGQEHAGSPAHRAEMLVVRVGKALYAMPLVAIGGVVPVDDLAPLPGAPAFIAGVGNLQGRVLTVVDLGVMLGEAQEPPRAAVLVEAGADSFALGVSSYEGLAPDPAGNVAPLPKGASSAAARYVAGVIAASGVGVLQLPRLIEDLLRGQGPDERK